MTRPAVYTIAGIAGLAIATTTALLANPGMSSSIGAKLKFGSSPVTQAAAIDGVEGVSLPKADVAALAPSAAGTKPVAKQDEAAKRKASRHTRRYARVRRPNVAPTSKT